MAFDTTWAAAATLIHSYTGLSTTEFFTIASLMVGVFFLVSWGFFVSTKDTQSRSALTTNQTTNNPPKPVQLGDMTLQELSSYNGSDPSKPLLVAIKGQVYDVSAGRLFYGPRGAYSFFAGKETSRALALMSFDPNDFNDNLHDLSEAEREILQEWEEKFKEKYVKVGQIVPKKVEVGDGNCKTGT